MVIRTNKPKTQKRPEVLARSLGSYLRTVDIFQDFTEEEIEEIHSIIPTRRWQRGTVVFEPGEPAEQIFILKEGSITLYSLTPDGDKLITDIVNAGTIFGEMALAGQFMRERFAEVQDDALVCTITQRDLERLLLARPQIGLRLLGVMGRRIRDLEERLEQMAYGSVRQRLVRFLIGQARPLNDGRQVKGYSHAEIGEAIGATRQTVTLELRQLEERGLLELGRRRLKLLDVSALRSAAG